MTRSATVKALVARHPALVIAIAMYVALSLWMQGHVFAFAEELMVHTAPPALSLTANQPETGPLTWEPTCGDGRSTLFSDQRPVFSLCLGERRFPLVVASYIGGYFYWPFAALAPLHHDDLRALRHLAMVFGILDLILTFLVVRRLESERLASAAVIAMAVSPCFQTTHAALVHFETLPWTWLMAAVLVLLDCEALRPTDAASTEARVPTGRLLTAALFVGFAAASNFKAFFLFLPMVLVALRFGVRVRAIRPAQWAASVGVALLPLVPAFAFGVAHPQLFLGGDRSGDIGSSLQRNLFHPELLVETMGDMLLFWSNLGRYMDPTGRAPVSVVAYALSLLALVWVLGWGTRALWQKRGSSVTAATAAMLASYLVMLTLLDRHYPVNFTPLHAAFGIAIAVAGEAFASRAFERTSARLPQLSSDRLLALVTGLLAIPFLLATIATGRAFYDLPAAFNLHAEEALLEHLDAVDPGDGRVHVVTTENLLAGVVESLSGGRIPVAQAQSYLVGCRRGERRHGEAEGPSSACFRERYERILRELPERPLRFVLAADLEVLRDRSRDGAASGMRDGLREAAAALGLHAEHEAEFTTASGTPAILVYRVDAP